MNPKEVLFPYEKIRPIQDDLINEVKTIIENREHLIVHAPTGLGKTAATLPAALKYAIDNKRSSVTIVHKGNIMKYTEGAFKNWCYEVAKEEFGNYTITEEELKRMPKVPEGKIIVKDRIADNMLQQVLTRTNEYDVIVLPNLNGDYLSDACSAQVGGLGMAPGANIGDYIALFEATHGTAPKYKGLDKVNPSSLILSGVMLLEYIGFNEAANLILNGIEKTIMDKKVTYDLARQMEGVPPIKTSEFAKEIVNRMVNQ